MKLVEILSAVKGKILESDQSKLPSGVLCRGVWPICNIGELNANKRMYEKEVWDKVIGDKTITEKMESRTLFGQAEHPEKTQSDLQLTSHIITSTFCDNVNEGSEQMEKAFQQIDVLDTPCGRIINTLIEAGCQVGMSTRAEGDLEEKEDKDGEKYHRVIPESYNYVTTDFTADPSTFNVAPVSVERKVVDEVVSAVHEKDIRNRISKAFAVSILEGCKGDDSADALQTLLAEATCKSEGRCICCKCGKCKEKKMKSIDDLINLEMVRLGAGVVIREGRFGEHKIEQEVRGEVTAIKEGQITIQLEDGTSISAETSTITTDNVEITLPEAAPEVEEPGIEAEELAAEMEEEPGEEIPGEEMDDMQRGQRPPGFESKVKSIKKVKEGIYRVDYDWPAIYSIVEADSEEDVQKVLDGASSDSVELVENYEHMVDWMRAKFEGASDKDLKVINNLVRTKLLNEKVTASSTSKEIRQLKIKEASTRAERDKAIEMLDEIETKLSTITERSPIEVRMLIKKLSEAKYTGTEVTGLCHKLEERQTALNEVKKKITLLNETIKETQEKAKAEKTSLVESYDKMMKDLKEEVAKECSKQLIEKYVELKLSHTGLRVHKNARALLEKCNSVDDVDSVFDEIKGAMRRDALRPGPIEKIVIMEKKEEDSSMAKTKELVKLSMSGMH